MRNWKFYSLIICLLVIALAEKCRAGEAEMEALQQNLYRHVRVLSVEIGERSIARYSQLAKAAGYIQENLTELGYKAQEQEYQMQGRSYRNLIAAKAGKGMPQEVILVGAHYDTVVGTPGADDNASGVAVLLELARLCRDLEFKRTVKMVAFCLEEPPMFRTPYMGSRVYARQAYKEGENIVAMLCLESLGYYSKQEDSQRYPLPFMGFFYPSQGDFITVVGNLSSRGLLRRVARGIKKGCRLPVETLTSPSFVIGVDFSDHASFWEEGYKAVMITDSAFYRNPHYHLPSDSIETLDFASLGELTKGLLHTIQTMAGQ